MTALASLPKKKEPDLEVPSFFISLGPKEDGVRVVEVIWYEPISFGDNFTSWMNQYLIEMAQEIQELFDMPLNIYNTVTMMDCFRDVLMELSENKAIRKEDGVWTASPLWSNFVPDANDGKVWA